EFRLEASYWTVKHKTYGGQVGLLLRYNHPGRAEQQVVWCTVASPVDKVEGKGSCQLRANIVLSRRKAGDSAPLTSAVRRLVDHDKLQRATQHTVLIGNLNVPEGTLDDAPEVPFRRLIHLALLKLPFLLPPGSAMGNGEWLFDRAAKLKESAPAEDLKAPIDEDEDEDEELDDPTLEKNPMSAEESAKQPEQTSSPSFTPCVPLNLILYGPPGTGKTWTTAQKALELVEPASAKLPRRELLERFRSLQAKGRIEMVTFHQAYGYEEFVEGIRPVLDQGNASEVRYTLQEGIFKRIALRAAAAGLMTDRIEPTFNELWNQLLVIIHHEGELIVQGKGGKSYVLRASQNDNLYTTQCEVASDNSVISLSDKVQRASKDNSRLIWDHRQEFGVEPDGYTHEHGKRIFSTEMTTQTTVHRGGHHYTALWIVYRELYELSRRISSITQPSMPSPERAQDVLDGKSPEQFNFTDKTPQFVLIIDEINRGNISKILGELITLLEPDKRLGADEATLLRLAGSPEHWFGIPPNLHVIGTMNTADRSIALMDVALRRRFEFEELMPNADVLGEALKGDGKCSEAHVQLVVELLKTLNQRIVRLNDRDHQLGHAYFLRATTLEKLRDVFTIRIIPLLQEYFYGAWDKMAVVLGCPYDDQGKPRRRKKDSTEWMKDLEPYSMVTVNTSVMEAFADDDQELEDIRPIFGLNPAFQRSQGAALIPYFLRILPLDNAGWEKQEKALQADFEAASSGTPA
ncbi:MAG: McrB family protein, partial [Myxococcota bacterium]